MTSEPHLACSLDSAELHDRLSEWRSVGGGALICETVSNGGTVAHFARSAEVARRLRELIEAERSCCPFLDFRLDEEDDVITVEVRPSIAFGAQCPESGAPTVP